MQTIDSDVLRHLLTWLDEGQRPWLCTIVGTTGSSPRPVGSMLGLADDGSQIGSVSGGCVEEDLLERLAADTGGEGLPQFIEYGVTAEENERLGLPCGGRLKLLLQRLSPADRDWLRAALEAVDSRQCVERQLSLPTGRSELKPVPRHTDLSLEGDLLRQCFGPRLRMLLVGAGQLAQSLAELALAMDYEVLVTDPRQRMLDQWEGPELPLLQGMPDDVVREYADDPHSLVITLTHDPRIDDMALMEALASRACYVGALGSVRTTEKRLRRLRELDLEPAQLERLHAPVGLAIGSKTPLEIAIAILAELVRLRRSGEL